MTTTTTKEINANGKKVLMTVTRTNGKLIAATFKEVKTK